MTKKQPDLSQEERKARKSTGKTQGRAGCYTDRINMAFTVDNYKFIKRFSKLRGQNMTDFVNHALDEYRAKHEKEFKAFERFINKT